MPQRSMPQSGSQSEAEVCLGVGWWIRKKQPALKTFAHSIQHCEPHPLSLPGYKNIHIKNLLTLWLEGLGTCGCIKDVKRDSSSNWPIPSTQTVKQPEPSLPSSRVICYSTYNLQHLFPFTRSGKIQAIPATSSRRPAFFQSPSPILRKLPLSWGRLRV